MSIHAEQLPRVRGGQGRGRSGGHMDEPTGRVRVHGQLYLHLLRVGPQGEPTSTIPSTCFAAAYAVLAGEATGDGARRGMVTIFE